MADNGSGGGNTGIVAVLVIFIIVVVLAVLAWRGGLFGGRYRRKVAPVWR